MTNARHARTPCCYLLDLSQVHWEEDVLAVVGQDVFRYGLLEDLSLQTTAHARSIQSTHMYIVYTVEPPLKDTSE